MARRRPFVAKSNVDFSALVFEGVHEYLDEEDTQRILFATSDGKIKEFVDADTNADRVTGLSTNKRTRFASINNVCFAVNGTDALQRGDATTWRIGGAPVIVANVSLVSGAGSNMGAGTYRYIVLSVIEVSGVGAVFSDWSDIQEITLGGAGSVDLTWDATADGRVTHYYIYRTKAGLGTPFFYDGKIAVGTEAFSSNTSDADLSEQFADILAINGTAPIGEIIASSNKRLIIGKLSGKEDAVHLSRIATNKYQMESFPDDGVHEFTLPGQGPVTAVIGLGLKDEDTNRNDLFLAQRESCYVLRDTDPLNPLDPISGSVGVLNPECVVQWGRYLFFLSLRGLEFLGPSGSPIVISEYIQPIFEGGGPLDLTGITNEDYLTMTIHENSLYITLQDSAGFTWANKVVKMDLEWFDPLNPTPEVTARFVIWENGPGYSLFLPTSDRELILFDNQNGRILKRATGTERQDLIGSTLTDVNSSFWSGALMGEIMAERKGLRYINCFAITDKNFNLLVEADFSNTKADMDMPIESSIRDWDKEWDKEWSKSQRWISTRPFPRRCVGQFFQFKFNINNESTDFIFIGMTIHYVGTIQRIMRKR